MTFSLDKILNMITAQSDAVNAQMNKLASEGSAISVTDMIKMQLMMNKFSQIADLGSTTVTIFNQSFKSMISNVLR